MVREYGYEYDAILDDSLWAKDAKKFAEDKLFGAYCLRSGRDALKAIAREYPPCIVYLPALICETVISPFLMWGHRISFYRLNADYSIKMEDVVISPTEHHVLFLYLDYFGNQAITEDKLIALKQKHTNIVFIEDRTHCFFSKKWSSFCPDYVVVSLRKWIAIPDGALLWGNVSNRFSFQSLFSEKRLEAQCKRHYYLTSGDVRVKNDFRKTFNDLSSILDSESTPCAMSLYSFHKALAMDWEFIENRRKENADVLSSILTTSKVISLIQKKTGLSDLYVPFMVPNRDEIQRKLSTKGIFNTIIWPLSSEQKSTCRIAKITEENMLAAPCDQRYECKDMEYIGNEIVRMAEDVNK